MTNSKYCPFITSVIIFICCTCMLAQDHPTAPEPRDREEVESVLAQHPRVVEAVLTASTDDRGEAVPEAHVELSPGVGLDACELRRFAERRLADFKIPARWRIYDRLPRTDAASPFWLRPRRTETNRRPMYRAKPSRFVGRFAPRPSK